LADGGRGLEAVLHLLAASQFFADTLTAYPDALPGVLRPPAASPSTAALTARLRAEVDAASDDPGVLRAFRRFRQVEMLRIGVNDILRDRPLEEVTRDLARLADASLEVALGTAVRTLGRKLGRPTSRITALGFGKLGGDELNYSSDIDLLFVMDEDGLTARKGGEPVPNAEFYTRAVTEVVRLLASTTAHGFAYRVDLRLRPGGAKAPLVRTLAGTLSYYDAVGRTWERQALIKARHVAGDPALGRQFLAAVEPFVYRKYFSFSEVNEVKALKRQMEARTRRAGADDTDVKTGRGGIRDVEYTVQFLQLLNGGDLPAVRQRNTLLALDALELAGCLTAQEAYLLADAYRFLRRTEHRLQLLFDRQTHTLPGDPVGLDQLARRMGFGVPVRSAEFGMRSGSPEPGPALGGGPDSALRTPHSALTAPRGPFLDEQPGPPPVLDALLVEPLDRFLRAYHHHTATARAVLDHLLHQTFAGAGGEAEPETDLILVQDPDPATVQAVLGRRPFRDVPAAYQNLLRLASEDVPFLSHRRCRHFFAGIAPALLRAVADTPDPDATLATLERVTASLGGKAVLYELFSFSPPALKLYVDLCATSPFLSGILVNNPGMIDELLDSLVLDQPRPAAELHDELAALLKGASDPDPILHSFQDKELLRVGVRHLLGRDDVRQTTAALTDIADAVLAAALALVEPEVRERYGVPSLQVASPKSPADASDLGLATCRLGTQPCRYAVVGLGKLGGREMTFHSDLDLLLLYEGDGRTTGGADNGQFFTDLGQRAIKLLSRPGPLGRLYEVDMRLRPAGKGGSLALSLAEFARYFAGGGAQPWERLALCRGRVAAGDPSFAHEAAGAVRRAALGSRQRPVAAAEVRLMRDKLTAAASVRSLKRGPGGLADVEFAVQYLQLLHAADAPVVFAPNLWDALDALAAAGALPADDAAGLAAGYSFLRAAEARVRLMTDRAMTELPADAAGWGRLARGLGFADTAGFVAELARVTADNRRRYEGVVGS
jgi:glutamate-ammonia-ligase adenylyltransferase